MLPLRNTEKPNPPQIRSYIRYRSINIRASRREYLLDVVCCPLGGRACELVSELRGAHIGGDTDSACVRVDEGLSVSAYGRLIVQCDISTAWCMMRARGQGQAGAQRSPDLSQALLHHGRPLALERQAYAQDDNAHMHMPSTRALLSISLHACTVTST